MAIETMLLDPNATDDLTPDEVVGKVNTATDQITRPDAIDAEALDIITTQPASGEFKVKKIQRDSSGKLAVDYDDVPEV